MSKVLPPVDQALRDAKRHANKGEANLAAQLYKNVPSSISSDLRKTGPQVTRT